MLDYIYEKRYFLGRLAFFVVFVWFGYLKIIDLSPAKEVVKNLFYNLHMQSLINFETFFYYLGVFEIIIGFGFLIGKFKKVVLTLFLVHMFTTFGPAIFDQVHFWQKAGVLTLEGQYIVKNLVFVMAGIILLKK